MARPRQHFPRGARTLLLSQAESGSLSETKAAQALGLSYKVFKRILRDNESAQEIWDEACAAERDAIRAKLSERARDGDTNALRLYLAAFHNVREQASGDDSGRAGVTINLPSPMNEQQYRRLFEQDAPALEAADGGGS